MARELPPGNKIYSTPAGQLTRAAFPIVARATIRDLQRVSAIAIESNGISKIRLSSSPRRRASNTLTRFTVRLHKAR